MNRSPRCLPSPCVRACAAALLAASLLAACTRKAPLLDPAYRAEIEGWRAERLAALKAEDGWLSLAGLYWLHPGENRFGTDPADEVVLRGAGVPAMAGTLELRPDGSVMVRPRPEASVTLAGAPPPDRPLRSDRTGRPDVLTLGGLQFYLIERSNKLAVRVKDTGSPARLHFRGLEYFPIDPSYRVVATFERYAAPREVTVATAQGPAQRMLAPGLVHFTLGAKPYALEPFVSTPDDKEFFFVFRDTTAGHESYGAGRFLDAAAPKPSESKLVLDFNRAYSPPCAFTPYATCPLPPRQNQLSIRIEAGEKFHGH